MFRDRGPIPLDETDDRSEPGGDEDPIPVFDQWMQRGDYLRQLRQLEAQDEQERRQQQQTHDCQKSEDDFDDEDNPRFDPVMSKRNASEAILSEADAGTLEYSQYLSHQRYHDDLKHVDYRFIDFGPMPRDDCDCVASHLVIEQDKALGKGGFCWDAAHILGDYLSSQRHVLHHGCTVIELGCGTGLCGMMVAKSCPGVGVTLSDLPLLMPLLERNLERNFGHNHSRCRRISTNDVSHALTADGPGSTAIRARVLEWTIDGSKDHTLLLSDADATSSPPCFDVIVAADVVASIYDPTALARTMHRLAHEDTIVFMSFKERLSSIHRQFEQEMASLFASLEFVQPTGTGSHTTVRNRNPSVQILIVRRKKTQY